MVEVAQRQQRMSYLGGGEQTDGVEHLTHSRRMESGSKTFSTSAIHLTAPALNAKALHLSRPKGYDSDDNLSDQLQEAERNTGGSLVPWSSSLEGSRSASNSSSSLTLKGRPESLSSEDKIPTKDMSILPRESNLCRPNAVMPGATKNKESPVNRNSPERKSSSCTQTRPRAGSPASEMVTLEEFLEESITQSPPSDTVTNRDDMLGDFFKKTTDPSAIRSPLSPLTFRDATQMPTSFVSPTVKITGDTTEGRLSKPGQYVKPYPRHLDTPLNGTYSLQHQPNVYSTTSSSQTPEPQKLSPHGTMGSRSTSLSRAFNLASADLLKNNSSEIARQEMSDVETPVGKDFGSHMLRSSTPLGCQSSLKEKLQSARMLLGDEPRCRSLDSRRLSLALQKEEPISQSAPSANSLQQHYTLGHGAIRGKSKVLSRSGEVALVSPVRPISIIPELEAPQGLTSAGPGKSRSTSPDCCPAPVCEEEPNKSGTLKSTPSSPDPSVDPQTLWYEYGCV